MPSADKRQLTDADYARLLAFRDGLRRFLRFSEERARAAGITPAHHQLLLVVRGHPDVAGPSIGEIADHLLLRQNSTVELVDRAEAAGLVSRHADPDRARVVRVRLTARGGRILASLSALHLEELERLAGELGALWEGVEIAPQHHGRP
ncbi:MAG: MarR family winged helix-turn-helix transcriptional regulator [Actinomycetota bacterium]|nr:MarR family winged helix-turn-helix transcriptional regulator [Actinomycetota bacterium]